MDLATRTSNESGNLELHIYWCFVCDLYIYRDPFTGGHDERVLRCQWRRLAICQRDGNGGGLDVSGDVYFDGRNHRSQWL